MSWQRTSFVFLPTTSFCAVVLRCHHFGIARTISSFLVRDFRLLRFCSQESLAQDGVIEPRGSTQMAFCRFEKTMNVAIFVAAERRGRMTM